MKKNTILKGLLAGMALTVLAGGVAMASETYTINASEAYAALPQEFIHKFAIQGTGAGPNDCDATATVNGTGHITAITAGDCNAHGAGAVDNWASSTFMNNEEFIPGGSDAAGAAEASEDPSLGYNMADTFNAFSTGGVTLSASLPTDWVTSLQSNALHSLTSTGSSASTRMEFIDQIMIGYIATPGGGDSGFAQNLRSHLTFGDSTYDPKTDGANFDRTGACLTDAGACTTIIDQRLEQGDTDMEGLTPGATILGSSGAERIISAFQQSFSAVDGRNDGDSENISVQSLGNDATGGIEGDGVLYQSQNVEQNMEGYFYSCMNCQVGTEHEFSAPRKLTMQAWLTDNPDITSVIHRDPATQTNRRY